MSDVTKSNSIQDGCALVANISIEKKKVFSLNDPHHNLLSSYSRESPASVKVKTSDAKRTLMQWKETYFETRAKIEASGRDARWEFDRKRLFERTDYMATICEDIHEVAQVGLAIGSTFVAKCKGLNDYMDRGLAWLDRALPE